MDKSGPVRLSLTVRLPWALFLVRSMGGPVGSKDIENRVWPAPASIIGQRIAIHAGKTLERRMYGTRGNVDLLRLTEAERLAGHVLGSVRVVGCHREGSTECAIAGCGNNPWAMWADPAKHEPKLYHWEIADPRELVTPFQARGAQKLWELSPREAHLLTIDEFR